ncbi:hypothetical protein MSAN_02207500 [Mycena sanguinolenta]|uniref:Uncharacterized protein n=1 Tax=Mycena sanguinolenta TaxID=230812 RepID=A0A8H7CJT5_9AGAR|nr:hypothetical protein MSAN_02207500 [Mycena sanguinolenta]
MSSPLVSIPSPIQPQFCIARPSALDEMQHPGPIHPAPEALRPLAEVNVGVDVAHAQSSTQLQRIKAKRRQGVSDLVIPPSTLFSLNTPPDSASSTWRLTHHCASDSESGEDDDDSEEGGRGGRKGGRGAVVFEFPRPPRGALEAKALFSRAQSHSAQSSGDSGSSGSNVAGSSSYSHSRNSPSSSQNCMYPTSECSSPTSSGPPTTPTSPSSPTHSIRSSVQQPHLPLRRGTNAPVPVKPLSIAKRRAFSASSAVSLSPSPSGSASSVSAAPSPPQPVTATVEGAPGDDEYYAAHARAFVTLARPPPPPPPVPFPLLPRPSVAAGATTPTIPDRSATKRDKGTRPATAPASTRAFGTFESESPLQGRVAAPASVNVPGCTAGASTSTVTTANTTPARPTRAPPPPPVAVETSSTVHPSASTYTLNSPSRAHSHIHSISTSSSSSYSNSSYNSHSHRHSQSQSHASTSASATPFQVSRSPSSSSASSRPRPAMVPNFSRPTSSAGLLSTSASSAPASASASDRAREVNAYARRDTAAYDTLYEDADARSLPPSGPQPKFEAHFDARPPALDARPAAMPLSPSPSQSEFADVAADYAAYAPLLRTPTPGSGFQFGARVMSSWGNWRSRNKLKKRKWKGEEQELSPLVAPALSPVPLSDSEYFSDNEGTREGEAAEYDDDGDVGDDRGASARGRTAAQLLVRPSPRIRFGGAAAAPPFSAAVRARAIVAVPRTPSPGPSAHPCTHRRHHYYHVKVQRPARHSRSQTGALASRWSSSTLSSSHSGPGPTSRSTQKTKSKTLSFARRYLAAKAQSSSTPREPRPFPRPMGSVTILRPPPRLANSNSKRRSSSSSSSGWSGPISGSGSASYYAPPSPASALRPMGTSPAFSPPPAGRRSHDSHSYSRNSYSRHSHTHSHSGQSSISGSAWSVSVSGSA